MDAAPSSPAPRNALALVLSLASLVAAPVLYLLAGLGSHGSSDGFNVYLVALGAGAVLWLAAVIVCIQSLVRASRRRESRTPGVLGLVFSALALVTGFYGALFGLVAAGGGAHGRPLRAGGRPTVAGADEGDGWSGDDVGARVEGLDDVAREALAARWTRVALEEHSSVPAFARLSLDLVALGAPASLVAWAHRAALDEVGHARVAFALAARYAGRPVGPSALPAAREDVGAETAAETLRRVARESLLDGVMGEGAAAITAAREAEREADPAVAAVLRRIAREEADHAALGAAVARYCAGRDDAVGADLRALAAEAASGEGDAARCAERFLREFAA